MCAHDLQWALDLPFGFVKGLLHEGQTNVFLLPNLARSVSEFDNLELTCVLTRTPNDSVGKQVLIDA